MLFLIPTQKLCIKLNHIVPLGIIYKQDKISFTRFKTALLRLLAFSIVYNFRKVGIKKCRLMMYLLVIV